MARRPATTAPPRPPLDAAGLRIAIVQADYHLDITHAMTELARQRAAALNARVVAEIHVAGAYDLPLSVQEVLRRKDVDAAVAIGCVVQGETGHDVAITHAALTELSAVACAMRKPVGLAVTGPRMTIEQARARIEAGAHAVDAVVVQAAGILRGRTNKG